MKSTFERWRQFGWEERRALKGARGEPALLGEGCGPRAAPACSEGGARTTGAGEVCKGNCGAERCAHPAGVWLCNGTAETCGSV
mgnify:CR=1 FL=1